MILGRLRNSPSVKRSSLRMSISRSSDGSSAVVSHASSTSLPEGLRARVHDADAPLSDYSSSMGSGTSGTTLSEVARYDNVRSLRVAGDYDPMSMDPTPRARHGEQKEPVELELDVIHGGDVEVGFLSEPSPLYHSLAKSSKRSATLIGKSVSKFLGVGKEGSNEYTFEEIMRSKDTGVSYCMMSKEVILFLAYFVVGAAVFCNIEERACTDQPKGLTFENVSFVHEGVTYTNMNLAQVVDPCVQKWTVLDAIYFSIVTLTTVGYGDLAPATSTGRIFAFFFVLYGLGVVFTIVNNAINAIGDRLRRHASDIFHAPPPTDAEEVSTLTRFIRKVSAWIAVIVCFVLIGGAIFAAIEDLSMLEGTWWAFITTLTVGYGDISVGSDAAKVFVIFYILITVITVATAIGKISSVGLELQQEQKRDALLKAGLNGALIAGLDEDGDGVDRYEFVIGMLKMLDILTPEQVEPWSQRFDALDADASGKLDREDLIRLEQSFRTGNFSLEATSDDSGRDPMPTIHERDSPAGCRDGGSDDGGGGRCTLQPE